MSSSDPIDYLKTINQTFYDQTKTADQKATITFTFVLALLLWSPQIREMFFNGWKGEPVSAVSIASLMLLFSLGFSILCAVLAVFPRNRPRGGALYWGAWPDAGEQLARALEGENPAFIIDDYLANIAHLAEICRRKFRYVRFAHMGFLVALACHVALLALS